MLTLAQVVDIHFDSHSVDLVMQEGGRRMCGVPVMTGVGGTNFGFNDLAIPTNTGYEAENSKQRDIYAVVGFINDHPMVLGFMFPQVCQMLFEDKERMVYRHASDAYVTIDKDANLEVFHPSGTYLRIGESSAHEDLTAKDFDKVWKIERNTSRSGDVHIEVESGGSHKSSFNMSKSGDVTIHATGNITFEAGGKISLKSGHEIQAKANSSVKVYAGGRLDLVGSGHALLQSTSNRVTAKSAGGVRTV